MRIYKERPFKLQHFMEKVDFHDKYRDFPWKTSPSHAPKEAYDGSEVEDDWRAAWNVIAELPTDASEGEDGTWGWWVGVDGQMGGFTRWWGDVVVGRIPTRIYHLKMFSCEAAT